MSMIETEGQEVAFAEQVSESIAESLAFIQWQGK